MTLPSGNGSIFWCDGFTSSPPSCGLARLITSPGWTANSENLRKKRRQADRFDSGWSTAAAFTPSKNKNRCASAPEQVHWFRWEAAMTWLSGIVLLFLVYYFSGGLVDPDVANISQAAGIAIGIGVLVFGLDHLRFGGAVVSGQVGNWLCDIFADHDSGFAYGFVHVFSGRAAYIHVGAMFGTIMVLNVWMRILPAQRKMIAAAAAGATFDPALGAQAKLRSKHNTFMAVPVVFSCSVIIFRWPLTGTHYSWQILVRLVLSVGERRSSFVRLDPRASNRRIQCGHQVTLRNSREEVIARCRKLARFQ